MDSYIIYHSLSTRSLPNSELEHILKIARTNNKKLDVTGCLIYYDEEFLQFLEGERSVLKTLYKKIKSDERHDNVVILDSGNINERFFNDWNMSFKKLDKKNVSQICYDMGILKGNPNLDFSIEKNSAFKLFSGIADEIINNPIEI